MFRCAVPARLVRDPRQVICYIFVPTYLPSHPRVPVKLLIVTLHAVCRATLPKQLPPINLAIEAVIQAGGRRAARRRSERTIKRAGVFRERLAAGVQRGFEVGSRVEGSFHEGRGVKWHRGRVIKNMHGSVITVRFDSDRLLLLI